MMYNMLGFETQNVHPQVDALSTYTTSQFKLVFLVLYKILNKGGKIKNIVICAARPNNN